MRRVYCSPLLELEISATATFSPLTLRGCFLIRGNQMQSHGLAAFPASVQLPKLAVDSIPALLPEKVVDPGSPQPPRLTVVSAIDWVRYLI